jgi:hypothetical protein
MQPLQADWALDRRDREQQRAKQAHFRAMLDEQVRRQTPTPLTLTMPHALPPLHDGGSLWLL